MKSPKKRMTKDEQDEALRTARIMLNHTTATVIALRGVMTCLLAGIEPTEEMVLELIAPTLNKSSPAARDFALGIEEVVSSIIGEAAKIRSRRA